TARMCHSVRTFARGLIAPNVVLNEVDLFCRRLERREQREKGSLEHSSISAGVKEEWNHLPSAGCCQDARLGDRTLYAIGKEEPRAPNKHKCERASPAECE